MQRSATDADPTNDAQLETELNMIQERRAAEMNDVAKMDARLAALAEEKAKIAARRAAAMGEVWPRWTLARRKSRVSVRPALLPRALPPVPPA